LLAVFVGAADVSGEGLVETGAEVSLVGAETPLKLGVDEGVLVSAGATAPEEVSVATWANTGAMGARFIAIRTKTVIVLVSALPHVENFLMTIKLRRSQNWRPKPAKQKNGSC
jgi:hypothetical protein